MAVLAVLGVASVFMYRTYNYVQHDNQFCLECHLMRDPYERFARSAHRGLGCKACHRPNIIQRSEMGLTQIVEQPESIAVHARVPNSVCAECHIYGNPNEWVRVANTAGHRIHLNSDDPSLQGLKCVQCHSTGVHEFTSTDQTCGQAGCHENTKIQLGKMAGLTIHCVTCHDFTTPVGEQATQKQVATSLRPQAEECLSCHAMRRMLANLPPDEPHNAECGACHNPHTQTMPRQAVQSCTKGGCHSQPDTITPFHRGLDAGVLADCIACHKAHTFRIHGASRNCLECHKDIYQDAPRRISTSAPQAMNVPARAPVAEPAALAAPAAGAALERPSVQLASLEPMTGLARLARAAHAAPAADDGAAMPQQVPDSVSFWHAQHRGVACTSCHSMQQSHGALKVTSIQDCRSCHHSQPVARTCTRCHTERAVQAPTFEVRRTMNIHVGSLDRPTRELPFNHKAHEGLACSNCHTGGVSLSATNVDCSSCHTRHHQPDANCRACHRQPPPGAHTAQVHLGCTGSGCHQNAPASVRAVPRTRQFCLVCHQQMVDHRPGRNCENCHTLPEPRSTAMAPGEGSAQLAGEMP